MSSAPLDLSLGRIEKSTPPQPSRAAGKSFSQELQRSRKSNVDAEEDQEVAVAENLTSADTPDTIELPSEAESTVGNPEQPSVETDNELPEHELSGDGLPVPEEPTVVLQEELDIDVLPHGRAESQLAETVEPQATEAAGAQQVLATGKGQTDEDGGDSGTSPATTGVQQTVEGESVSLAEAGDGAGQQQSGEEFPSSDQTLNPEETLDGPTQSNSQPSGARQVNDSEAKNANDALNELESADPQNENPATEPADYSTPVEQRHGPSSGERNSGGVEIASKAVESLEAVSSDSATGETVEPAVQPSASNPQAPPSAATRARFSEALVGRAAAAKEDVSLTPAQRGRFVNRVSRAIEVAGNTDGVVRLRLSPKALGALTMQVQLDGQSLSATIEAESQNARNLLLDNLPVLRERLASQNISIESFDVNVSDQEDQQGAANQREQLADQQRNSPEPESRRNRDDKQQRENAADEKSPPLSIDDDPDGLNVTV